jgi:hypothetical protein
MATGAASARGDAVSGQANPGTQACGSDQSARSSASAASGPGSRWDEAELQGARRSQVELGSEGGARSNAVIPAKAGISRPHRQMQPAVQLEGGRLIDVASRAAIAYHPDACALMHATRTYSHALTSET